MANVPITSLPTATVPAMDDYLILQGANTQKIKWSSLLNKLWPVGSIYQSTSSTSPASFLGGTWERIKDRFLLAAGDTYSAGSTGGEAVHTLTVQELPEVSGTVGFNSAGNKLGLISSNEVNGVFSVGQMSDGEFYPTGNSGGTKGARAFSFRLGGSAAHNNMPPYLTVYVWKRTA